MEAQLTSIGSSLQVPSVQELAKRPMVTIPPQYVRDDQDPLIISNDISSSPDIPVIDLQSLLSSDSMNSELEKLHSACKKWGFFQLINHGISSRVVEKVKQEIQHLFNLPMEEKKKLWQQPGDAQGFGQLFVVSKEQKLDWADIFYLLIHPTQLRNPKVFSKLPISFRETMLAYLDEVASIAAVLLDHMAKALKIRAEETRELIEGELMQVLRINYYPPCPKPELVLGLTPHSDASLLTILLQVNQVDGLQIDKDGMWIPIRPLPNAFVVNVGDSLEIVSNGIYKSINHRAVVNSETERISVGVFHSPKFEGELGPAPSLVTPETPALFKRVGVAEYYRRFLGRKLHEKSNIVAMRIENEEGENN